MDFPGVGRLEAQACGEKATALLRTKEAEERVAMRIRQLDSVSMTYFVMGKAKPPHGSIGKKVLERGERERRGELARLGAFAVDEWVVPMGHLNDAYNFATRVQQDRSSPLQAVTTTLKPNERMVKHMVATKFAIHLEAPLSPDAQPPSPSKGRLARGASGKFQKLGVVRKAKDETNGSSPAWLPFEAVNHFVPVFPMTAPQPSTNQRRRPQSARASRGDDPDGSGGGGKKKRPSSARPSKGGKADSPALAPTSALSGSARSAGALSHLHPSATLPVRGTARLFGRTPTLDERRSVSVWASPARARRTREDRIWRTDAPPVSRAPAHPPPGSTTSASPPRKEYLRARTGNGGGALAGPAPSSPTPPLARQTLIL